jgi:hypothetical protein
MDKETQMQGGKMSELEKMGGKEFYSIFVKAIESFTFGEMKYDEFIILDRALLSRLERGERAEKELLGLIRFIPEGWPMPLGYNQLVAQIKDEFFKEGGK